MRNVWLTYLYYGITAVSVVVLFLSIKYLLGGYNEVIISPTNGINYLIAGKYIDESWSEEQQLAFKAELDDKAADGKARNRVVEIAFFPDSLIDTAPFRFLGLAMQGNVVTIPAGYKVIDIREAEALETLLTMHPMVRPSLKDVRNQMRSALKEEQKQLDERMLLFSGLNDSLTLISGVRSNDAEPN